MARFGTASFFLVAAATTATWTSAFVPASKNIAAVTAPTTTTSLHAIGVLAKKAKEATLREYISGGIEDSVMEQYKIIQKALASDDDDDSPSAAEAGPFQQSLTKRKGTITVIAEYKRKLADSGYVKGIFDPEILSPEFREFGASGIAVMADEKMGGCTYDDLQSFVEEQRRAKNEVIGSVPVINNDLIIDELQIARSAAYGCKTVVLQFDILGDELTAKLIKASRAVNLEVIVSVATKEDAMKAVNELGATMISVINVQDMDERAKVIEDLNKDESKPTITTIANINAKNNKGLEEVEDAWACRDLGFHCVWVGDVLYKSGNNEVEHPGAILKAMTAKSSLRWASPQAFSGRGEGATEYLGDILM